MSSIKSFVSKTRSSQFCESFKDDRIKCWYEELDVEAYLSVEFFQLPCCFTESLDNGRGVGHRCGEDEGERDGRRRVLNAEGKGNDCGSMLGLKA